MNLLFCLEDILSDFRLLFNQLNFALFQAFIFGFIANNGRGTLTELYQCSGSQTQYWSFPKFLSRGQWNADAVAALLIRRIQQAFTEDILFPDFEGFALENSHDKPYHFPDYYKLGDQEFQKNKFEDAISNYTTAIRMNPQNGDAYMMRALAKFRLDQYEDSIEDFDEAIKSNKSRADFYYGRGFVNKVVSYQLLVLIKNARLFLNIGNRVLGQSYKSRWNCQNPL